MGASDRKYMALCVVSIKNTAAGLGLRPVLLKAIGLVNFCLSIARFFHLPQESAQDLVPLALLKRKEHAAK